MIYICVPAHNEEQTVGVVLWKVRQVMAELGRDYQLLVADDGSTDRTPAVLEPYTRVLPLTVMRNESRRGYAAALEMLLREAVRRSEYPRRDTVVILQADFSEDPEHVATLIKRLESGADIVASNAVYGGPEPRRGYRWGRALLDRLLRRFSWPEGVRDPVGGLNTYRVMCVKGALESEPEGRLLKHEGWAANAELLRAAAPAARRIDTMDLELRRDRLQRAERFHFATAFKQVVGYVRRRPVPARSVEDLAPDVVLGGRSQLRALTVEGLREQGYANGADAEPRRRRSGGRRPGERDEGRRGRGDRERSPGRARAGSADEGDRPRRKKKRPAASAQAAEAVANGKAPDAAVGEQTPRPKSRRRSRGGAKNRGRGAPEALAEGTSAATDAPSAEGPEPSVAVSDADSQSAQAARKRRRGSRGGRRRKRGQRGGGDDAGNANSNEAPNPPATEAG